MWDLLIVGGALIDGSGAPARPASIALRGDRISAIDPPDDTAAVRLDASGCVVCPGFIDVHGHSDSSLFLNRRMESKVRQGITTEIIGNCGTSLAPLAGEAVGIVERELDGYGVLLTWRSVADYLAAVEAGGVAVNVGLLTGHDALRHSTVGTTARPATMSERTAMAHLLDRALADGAIGLSSGLAYTPGAFAEPDEIAALASVVAGSGIYATHLRDEGAGLRASIAEALDVTRRSGVTLEISHLKASGASMHGSLPAILDWLAAERDDGLDVGWDCYPYTAASTTLAATFPPWLHDGGRLLDRLADPTTRERIREAFAAGGWPSLALDAGWDGIIVTGARGRPEAAGHSIATLAGLSGRDPVDEAIDLLVASGGSAGAIFLVLDESDVRAAVAHPVTVFGTDSAARAPEGRLGRGQPHPRGYGAFPRLLGRYADSLPDLVRRMTALPAERFGLGERGLVIPGAAADLVVFDPATVADVATYQNPHRFPVGVRWVIVNGTVVVGPEGQRDALPGRVLRS